jgi:hypothetical protein
VDHSIDNIRRLRVSGGTAGFETSALIDGYIYNRSARFHGLDHSGTHQFRRRCAGHQHGTDYQVRFHYEIFDSVWS